MHYRINHAGNRIVDATPSETHALRPALLAAFRRWRADEFTAEDLANETEVLTWQALAEGRVWCDRFTDPEDALWQWAYATAWNLWRNHSRRRYLWCEILVPEVPDVGSPCPVACLESRDAIRRIAGRSEIASTLLAALKGERAGMPRSTFHTRRVEARKQARAMLEHSRKPPQPIPPTPWKRKAKR